MTDGFFIKAVFDGTTPTIITEKGAFSGFSDSVACGINGKYKVAITDTDGTRGIYVLDTYTGLWHREDDKFNTRIMFTKDGAAFYIGEDEESRTYTLFTDSFKRIRPENASLVILGYEPFTAVPEDEVLWYCETGKTGDSITSYNKKVRTVRLYLTLGEDSFVRAAVKTDCCRDYQEIFYLDKKTEGICAAVAPTVPCKYFTLRLSGKGEFTLHSLDSVVLLQGEVKNFE